MSLDSWTLDYCMVCDRQTPGGPYCSQACRLSEMDSTPPASSPVSPTFPPAPLILDSHDCMADSNPAGNDNNYTISLNDHLHIVSPAGLPPASSNGNKRNNKFTLFSDKPSTSQPYIHNTGSQSSLNSLRSSASQSSSRLSPEAMSELKYYSNLFDSVRKWKSKISYSSLS